MKTDEAPAPDGEDSSHEASEPPTLAELCEACTDLAAQIAAHFEDLRKR